MSCRLLRNSRSANSRTCSAVFLGWRDSSQCTFISRRGFNPIAWRDALDEADRQTIRSLLEPLGEVPVVAEKDRLEAYAILAAMGPTYFWPQWLELESLVDVGLLREDARQALRAMTVARSQKCPRLSQLTPDEVVDLIPVKPLADFEPELRAAYRSRLTARLKRFTLELGRMNTDEN